MSRLDLFMDIFVSRRNDFALQRTDGGYVRVGRALTSHDVHAHLTGAHTIGSYLIDEHGSCRYAVFDADSENGLSLLHEVQGQFEAVGMASYLEQSRRGGHLWVFLSTPTRASLVRAWLLPFCPAGVEFYPKQAEGRGFGSLMRLPLGVHHLSGKRYPFVAWTHAGPVPMARSVTASLEWLASVERVAVPSFATCTNAHGVRTPQETSFSKKGASSTPLAFASSIRAWCAAQDPFTVIGRYVALNHRGVGKCPFGWHHSDGRDSRDSFKVYHPGVPGGYCWYCYVWQQGGSVFDFLRLYHNLDARMLWERIQRGSVTW